MYSGQAARGLNIVAVAAMSAGSASTGGLVQRSRTRLNTCAQVHLRHKTDAERAPDPNFGVVRQVIAHAAASRDLSTADLASTAVLALSEGSSTMTAHVGDGAILARLAQTDAEETSRWRALSWPEHGEYVSTTYFVTDAELKLRIASHAMAVDRLVVITDGLERLALNFADATPTLPSCKVCAPLNCEDRPRMGGRTLFAVIVAFP